MRKNDMCKMYTRLCKNVMLLLDQNPAKQKLKACLDENPFKHSFQFPLIESTCLSFTQAVFI